MNRSFEYGTTRVRDLVASVGERDPAGNPRVNGLELNAELLKPTARFWRSFSRRFRISEKFFHYFSHAEVFERVSECAPSDRFQYCIERDRHGEGRLLAVSAPGRQVVDYACVQDLVNRYSGQDVKYSEGVVTSTHVPRSGDQIVKIGGDKFENRFVMSTPIDGYGLPQIHLSLMRAICTNGMIGYSRAFRSEISIGKDPAYGLRRALETYDNDNGYAALWQRFESAQQSWASLRETQDLYSLLIKQEAAAGFGGRSVLADFYKMSGRPHELYGVANLDTFSVKRQALLPTKCRVYDLLNFAGELATHRANVLTSRNLQAYIGNLISDEYDLEGTAEKVIEFQDFFVRSDSASGNENRQTGEDGKSVPGNPGDSEVISREDKSVA